MSETTYYRNDPASTFEAHLFDADEVHEAGGDADEKSERPAASICSRTTAYGPFTAVEDGAELERDNGTCEVCLDMAAAEVNA